ncbi:MAG: efflux RND transporter periplasmic adaptor subunit [Alphaproteobacteria bacterium]|uniref:efflux RND transporter periplasmic adaptor subunit n=1 Tax=Hyphomonas sp. TaxID=87 RepID=UPI001D4DD374|nr:efflux RND transporter periplasmic adaptor subunit [Alphaproteobacteria bacterium]MBU2085634.1 efflux RND transporter periplasmic adaptor subunit [Alphaproteobacteria bacterium]MBU2141507.1 efflux RND transporter periplasmic adaptor subunit [Alphaproteobacteria bacterium]MBU2197863.1 efflux RND transporter periplasmic adaptor subunit [Alphaproteobacteria bacterium]
MGRLVSILAPLGIIVVVGGIGSVVLHAIKPEPEKADEARAGLNVFAEPVRRGDLHLTVEAQGEVRPRREIVVAPQITGRVSYVSPDFIDGGFIKRGQLLVRVEAADYELGVVSARSGVASAEQALAREIAEAELARQDILDLGLDNASPLARREPQLAQARAALDGAKAQLKDAELALDRTAIYAPFDGRVRERNVDIGQVAAAGSTLGRIFANDVVEVSLPLDDSEMGRLGLPLAFAASKENPGPKVTFTGNVAGQPRTWIGEVVRTAAAVNSMTRQINVIAELQDPYGTGADGDAPMAPGLFVNALIEGATIPDVLIAPRGALRGEDQLFIGDPKQGKLSIRTVDLIFSDTDGAYVRSGISEGELAIVSPVQAAFDGMSITVMQRLEDGTVKVYEPEEAGTAATATASSATQGAEGTPQ